MYVKIKKLKHRKKKSLFYFILLLVLFEIIFSKCFFKFSGIYEKGVEINNILDVNNKDSNLNTIAESSPYDIWWNASWHYRVPIIISSNQDLHDYQIQININLTEFQNLGYINENGNDIRFINESNNELNFWIEEMGVFGMNSTIWVKIPEIKSPFTKIYMYFGNPNVASKSNGTRTFNLFDDFEKSNLDSIWRLSSPQTNYIISNGILRINSGAIGLNNSLDFNIQDGYIVESKILFNEPPLANVYSGVIPELSSSRYTTLNNGNEDATIFWMRQKNTQSIYYWVADGSTTSYNLINGVSLEWVSTEYIWYLSGISVIGGNSDSTIQLWKNRENLKTLTGVYWNDAIKFVSLGHFNGEMKDCQDTSYDWIRIRKYILDEPKITFGEPEKIEYKITCYDLDGRRVSNAKVFITNKTFPFLNKSGITNINGEVVFVNVSRTGIYNITVNYTSQNGLYTETVYSKNNIRLYDFTELELYLNLWTIDFDVIDWDNNTMDYGYVVVYKDIHKTQPLANITLQSGTGKATFRWINKSYYTYDVYYRNEDYFQRDTLINNGMIQRKNKKRNQVFYVNQTNIYSKNRLEYRVEQTIWAEGSDEIELGHIRIINATINLNNMEDNVSSVEVFYVDSNGVNKINEASKTYSTTTTQDTIKINTINQYDMFGLKIIVEGGNSSRCNGTIDLHWVETTTPIVQVNMSKMHIKVEDGGIGVVGAIVRIWNGSVNTGQSIINLTTSSGEVYGVKGYAYGTIHKIEFWYLIGTNYNITIDIGTQQQVRFNVSYSIFKSSSTHLG